MKAGNGSKFLFVVLALLAAFVGVAAQARPKIPPPEFNREWELDAAGLRQWKPFSEACAECKSTKVQICEHCKNSEVPICLECDGKKRAPCRVCGGKEKLPDPLVELACPYCTGSSWYACGLCNSFGFMNIDSVQTKCGACKQKGLLKCGACNGTRRVDTARVAKKHVGELGSKELKELLVRLREAQGALEKFEPESNPSKSAKLFAKVLEPAEKDLKVLKTMQTMLDDVLKGVKAYGAGYSGFEERLKQQFFLFKDRTVFLLQHQIRAAEQALLRAEFNESK
ncbi:MAG: hypothetical protein IPK67_00720 [Planctomycetes bacterium]|nr:hypothetical protein [Planctomycetota bacterium]